MLLAINGVGFTLLSLARLRAHTAYCHWHERVNYFMSAKVFLREADTLAQAGKG
jgi:hypothetical protein